MVLAQSPELAEARAKVILVEKLVRFVDWPTDSGPAERPFILGVVGRTPFGDELDEYFKRRTLKNRPVRIRYFKDAADLEACDLLFICASERDRLPALLARTRQRPILTLSESQGFTKAGVMVGMIREGDHIGFELNLGRAKESGFRFTPGFTQLAKIQG
jgi:hypothetical protein